MFKKNAMTKWECPECGATPDEHGEGQCMGGYNIPCGGFICECENEENYEDETHGFSQENPCLNAICYHCGWGGRFPPKDTRSKMKKKVISELKKKMCSSPEETADWLIKYITSQVRKEN